MQAKPKITEFSDYRIYLKEIFAWRKLKNKNFSYEYCAKKLGTSKSYLKQVLDKKIHVDLNRADSLARLFQLNAFEGQYFLVLILQNQIRNENLKRHFLKILNRFKLNDDIEGYRAYRTRTQDNHEPSPDWLSQSIASMTCLPDFSIDAKWLQRHLCSQVSIKEIEYAVRNLLKQKTIYLDGTTYRETNSHHSPDPFDDESQKRYLHGAYKTIDIIQNDFSAHCPAFFFNGALGLNSQDFAKISDAYYEFVQKIVAVSEQSKNPDAVIFVSNNIFHVAKTAGKKA